MNRKFAAIGILSSLLLTGCVNSTSSESMSSESVIQSTEQAPETEIGSTNITNEETQVETEDNYIRYPSNPRLMYNGEIYGYTIGSRQVEIDGKYYELEGEEAFIDTERLKNESEYIGESVSVTDDHVPTFELELTYAISDMPCELYKIDENQILVYSNEDLEIPEEWSEWAIVYPGTYRLQWIFTNDISTELLYELTAKYYRYAERFPEDYGNDTAEESTGTSSDSVFPPEGIIAPTVAIPSEHQYETGEEIPDGYHPPDEFELDGVKYCDAVQYGSFAFVIEDDGNIVVEGEPEHEDNEVVKALREIYSLEYVGISHLNEHLFRYGDGLLAIAKSPAEKNQSVYFKDYDYDESQFYYALIYEPDDN